MWRENNPSLRVAEMSVVRDAIKRQSKHKDKLLTPLLLRFMTENELFKFNDDAIKIANNIMKQERVARNNAVFHPSGSYQCMRKQVLDVIGWEGTREEELQLLSIFDDGKWRHLRWHLLLYRMGVSDKIEEEQGGILKRTRGTPDQILNLSEHYPFLAGKRVGFEMKGTHSRRYNSIVRDNRPIFFHLYQIVTYMVNAGIDVYTLVYENKDTQEFYEFNLVTDKKYLKHIDAIYLPKLFSKYIMARNLYMNRSIENGVLPAHECTMEKDDTEFVKCPQKDNCAKLTKKKKVRTAKEFPNRITIEDKLYRLGKKKEARTYAKYDQRERAYIEA